MSRLRNSYEHKLMRESGRIAGLALKKGLAEVKVGVSGLELDKIISEEIYKLGGDLSYKTVPGYEYATCITINEEVVHGIPKERKFASGDLISVDLAVVYKGWHTDCAWTVLVGEKNEGEKTEEKERFLKAGKQALQQGIDQAVDGNRVGDISQAIQTAVEEAGYSVVRSLVGHGIGRKLHEDPEIPGFGQKGQGPFLKNGMALAVEVIYAAGESDVVVAKDGWTFVTADSSWGGLFEASVIAGKNKAEILTDLPEI